MTIKEFAERTGFEPTIAEYEEIERDKFNEYSTLSHWELLRDYRGEKILKVFSDKRNELIILMLVLALDVANAPKKSEEFKNTLHHKSHEANLPKEVVFFRLSKHECFLFWSLLEKVEFFYSQKLFVL